MCSRGHVLSNLCILIHLIFTATFEVGLLFIPILQMQKLTCNNLPKITQLSGKVVTGAQSASKVTTLHDV